VIHVEPTEPTDQHWRDWRRRAGAATQELIAAGVPPEEIDEQLYKGGFEKILALFNEKCAYCEAKITADQIRGDVEHFRPKRRVRDEKGNVVYIAETTPHPGYFWLAYEWTNLLPSCISCNRPHRNAAGESVGKADRFPLVDEKKRAKKPADHLPAEAPLLLNPYVDDPAQHLKFDPEVGTVSGITDRGRITAHLLDLNRDGLVEERRARARAAADTYNAFLSAVQADNQGGAAERLVDVKKIEAGLTPYSAIARVLAAIGR
jgi:hypothetical protein